MIDARKRCFKMNSIINKAIALAALLPLVSLAQLEPLTEWGDVPPSTTLFDAVKAASKTNVEFQVQSKSLTILTNNVPIWSSGATEKNIAMFIIPLNADASTNSITWRGFELKATTNNFGFSNTAWSQAELPESSKLQFYAQSDIADKGQSSSGETLGIDKMRIYTCFYLDGDDGEIRAYKYCYNTIDCFDANVMLVNVVVLIDTRCLIRHPEAKAGDWLSNQNDELVWLYLRTSAGSIEYQNGTSRPQWRPIAPVKWFSKMPKWAEVGW